MESLGIYQELTVRTWAALFEDTNTRVRPDAPILLFKKNHQLTTMEN